MSDQPAIILHVGAPKCGARALQRALSAAPLLTTDSGTLAYTVLHPKGSGWTQLSGRALRSAAARDVAGRLGWPDMDEDTAAQADQLDRLRAGSGRRTALPRRCRSGFPRTAPGSGSAPLPVRRWTG